MRSAQNDSTSPDIVQAKVFAIDPATMDFVNPAQHAHLMCASPLTARQRVQLPEPMPVSWGGFWLCPYFGCGKIRDDADSLHTHCASHQFAVNASDWHSQPVPIPDPEASSFGLVFPEPQNADLCPDKLSLPVEQPRPDQSCYAVKAFRVGAYSARSRFANHIRLAVELPTLDLSIVHQSTPDVAHSVHVPRLGLEDIRLLCNDRLASHVELLLSARVAHLSDGGLWSGLSPGARGAQLAIRLSAADAVSFLYALASPLAAAVEHGGVDGTAKEDAAFPLVTLAAELRHRAVAYLTSLLRMSLTRRDLLNRGWTDDDLQQPPRLKTLLSQHEDSTCLPVEKHRYGSSCAVAVDAPQLGHHMPVVAAVAATDERDEAVRTLEALETPREDLLPPLTRKRVRPKMEAGPTAIGEVAVQAIPVHKPKTAYQLFHMVQVAELKKLNPAMKHQTAFKKAGLMWSELSSTERAAWQVKADVKPRTPPSNVPHEVQAKRAQLKKQKKKMEARERERDERDERIMAEALEESLPEL